MDNNNNEASIYIHWIDATLTTAHPFQYCTQLTILNSDGAMGAVPIPPAATSKFWKKNIYIYIKNQIGITMLSLFVDALYYDLSYASNVSILCMPTPHHTAHTTTDSLNSSLTQGSTCTYTNLCNGDEWTQENKNGCIKTPDYKGPGLS